MIPNIIPIRHLSNKTSQIVELCENTQEPVFVTKNGYGSVVIMSMETYRKKIAALDLYEKLAEGEKDIEEKRVIPWEKVRDNLLEIIKNAKV